MFSNSTPLQKESIQEGKNKLYRSIDSFYSFRLLNKPLDPIVVHTYWQTNVCIYVSCVIIIIHNYSIAFYQNNYTEK